MFQNPIPSFEVPTYLIHVNCGAHVSYHDQNHCNTLCIKASYTSEGLSNQCYPWQKVLVCSRATPQIFIFYLFYLKRNTFASFGIRWWTVTYCVWSDIPGDIWCCQSVVSHWSFDTHVLSAKCFASSTTIVGPLNSLNPMDVYLRPLFFRVL